MELTVSAICKVVSQCSSLAVAYDKPVAISRGHHQLPSALEIPIAQTNDSHNAVSFSLMKYALRSTISRVHRNGSALAGLLLAKFIC